MSATKAPGEAAAVEFPAPLSAAQRLARAANFWARAVPVMVSYMRVYTGFQLRERLLGQCLSEDECEVVWEAEHEKGAATLADAIHDLRGFYVKAGQIIASRQDLFPSQYIDRLAGLTDLLDPMPVSLVKAVICQELLLEGESFEDVFVEFDDAPLGAASVAQVKSEVGRVCGGNLSPLACWAAAHHDLLFYPTPLCSPWLRCTGRCSRRGMVAGRSRSRCSGRPSRPS
jgi:hypothetical protein